MFFLPPKGDGLLQPRTVDKVSALARLTFMRNSVLIGQETVSMFVLRGLNEKKMLGLDKENCP